MGRWVAIDYGKRRIGLAISDGRGVIASPAVVIDAPGTTSADAATVLEWAGQQEAGGILVGLPLNMDGSDSDQTRLSRALADELRKRTPLPVELWDERLSTFQADEHLAAGGVRPSRRRRLRDALAAQVVLQSFLDARRTDGGARG
jgi:putative Holliday junction resolvase